MKSQWDCVLENLGEWQGSFTKIAPTGDQLEEVPSLISIQGVNDNRAVHLALKRFYPDASGAPSSQPHELVRDFSSPGAGAVFFDTGAFSEGALSVSTGLKFGAEFSFLHGDRRMRLVQMFDATSSLAQLTLIREQRVGSTALERPPLLLDDLLKEWHREWQGESLTLYPNTSERQMNLTISQSPTENIADLKLEPPARMQFEQAGLRYQMVLLADGAFTIFPAQIETGHAFFLETGWYLQPDARQRLIRRYDAGGNWISATWLSETKI